MNAKESAHSATLLLRVVPNASTEVVTTTWKKVRLLRTLLMPGRTSKSKSMDLSSSRTTPSSSWQASLSISSKTWSCILNLTVLHLAFLALLYASSLITLSVNLIMLKRKANNMTMAALWSLTSRFFQLMKESPASSSPIKTLAQRSSFAIPQVSLITS